MLVYASNQPVSLCYATAQVVQSSPSNLGVVRGCTGHPFNGHRRAYRRAQFNGQQRRGLRRQTKQTKVAEQTRPEHISPSTLSITTFKRTESRFLARAKHTTKPHLINRDVRGKCWHGLDSGPHGVHARPRAPQVNHVEAGTQKKQFHPYILGVFTPQIPEIFSTEYLLQGAAGAFCLCDQKCSPRKGTN